MGSERDCFIKDKGTWERPQKTNGRAVDAIVTGVPLIQIKNPTAVQDAVHVGRKGVVKASPKAKAIKRRVMIDGSITVADLAHAMSQKSGAIIKTSIGTLARWQRSMIP